MNVEGAEEPLTMCMCHVDSADEGSKLTTGGYYCPQCYSKYCELPVECRACGLTLVSAPHLARSYHHLFPACNYEEILYDSQVEYCYACQKGFSETDKQVYSLKIVVELILTAFFPGLQVSQLRKVLLHRLRHFRARFTAFMSRLCNEYFHVPNYTA